MQSQRNKYLENAVQTAAPQQLVIMLCDGAIRFLKQGIEAIRQKKMQDAHNHLIRVQDIILEFAITLDKTAPVSEGLLKLYDYFMYRLMEANAKKDIVPAEEVLGYLIELKETWVQAATLVSRDPQIVQHG